MCFFFIQENALNIIVSRYSAVGILSKAQIIMFFPLLIVNFVILTYAWSSFGFNNHFETAIYFDIICEEA